MAVNNANSVDLVKSLQNIMNLLDTITEHLPEGIYLQICNELKLAHSNANQKEVIIQYIQVERERIVSNPIVVHHTKMSKQARKARNVLSDEEKIRSGYEMCGKCNRLVRHLWRHQNQTRLCGFVEDVKQVVNLKKGVDIKEFMLNMNKFKSFILCYEGFNTKLLNLREIISKNRYLDDAVKQKGKYYYNSDAFIDRCWIAYYGEEFYNGLSSVYEEQE
jgi:hypothetical protein